MASYLKKYATALASAKDYVAQWSSNQVYADEALIVPFPTLAIYDPNKQVWSINIKAWLYLPFEGKKLKSYLPSLTGASARKAQEAITFDNKNHIAKIKREDSKKESTDDDDDDDADLSDDAIKAELSESSDNPGRLGLFFVGNSVKVATKSIINGVEHLLQPSDESGFIEHRLELSDQEVTSLCNKIHPKFDDRKFDYEIQIHESKTQATTTNSKGFPCTIYVLAAHGISIISDIDDTIKVSKVVNKTALLKHTFYDYFKPVDGMSELYQKWSEQNCQFHYVSASPWQLFPALRSFLEKHKYPMGTMDLRKFTWSLKFLKPSNTYKIDIITQIINAYPLRKYICVGDSGEIDPEVYAQLYTLFPQNITHIFIRDVCHIPECLPACTQRYMKVFENVPIGRWTVFRDPKEIHFDLDNLIAE